MRIEKHFQMRIPINIERLVRKLLVKVPEDHLVGLGSIILVDQVTHKRDKKSEGLYWQSKGQELAKIEIGVNTIYRAMPRFIFYLPFIAKFMLATVLYHEIGHHAHRHGFGQIPHQEKEANQFAAACYRRSHPVMARVVAPLMWLFAVLSRAMEGQTRRWEHEAADQQGVAGADEVHASGHRRRGPRS